MLARLTMGLLLTFALFAAPAYAQLPGVDQMLIAHGSTDHADEVDGPADLYIGTITLGSGAHYGGWHTHPGVVWVVVTSGELTLYGPDGCATIYSAASGYRAEPDTLYDLRNETSAPVELAFSGVIRAGEAPNVFIGDSGPTCGR